MNGYITFGTAVLVLVAVGVVWRIRRAQTGSALGQLLEGLNVFFAGLLAWMTAVTLFIAFNATLGLSEGFLKASSIAFVVVVALIWVFRGLVPQHTAPEMEGKRVAGHMMLLVGTVAHGSVTFYIPVLVWFGWLNEEASAVLPWFAIFTLPAACLLWARGYAMILDSGSPSLIHSRHSAPP